MIEIIKMTENNYKDVSRIASACLEEAWSEKSYFEQLSNPIDNTLVAVCDVKSAGFLSVWYVAGEIEINNIAVLPEFRRMGIADKLLSHMFQMFPEADSAYLEVRESNLPAQKLYEKHGFVRGGERKNYYKNPIENAILMSKNMKDE